MTEILLSFIPQGNKKFWVPSKQKCLEFDVKELTHEIKMTAEVKIESDALWCSGQVIILANKPWSKGLFTLTAIICDFSSDFQSKSSSILAAI